MSFWCPFLDPHLTTYHSNIGVHILAMLDLGMSRENQAYKEKKSFGLTCLIWCNSGKYYYTDVWLFLYFVGLLAAARASNFP